MNFYEIPANLSDEIDDLEYAINEFILGTLYAVKFRAIRVVLVYTNNAQMVHIWFVYVVQEAHSLLHNYEE